MCRDMIVGLRLRMTVVHQLGTRHRQIGSRTPLIARTCAWRGDVQEVRRRRLVCEVVRCLCMVGTPDCAESAGHMWVK